MNEVIETKILTGTYYCNVEDLINKLQEIRRMSNKTITAELCGSFQYGYSIKCTWRREKTEEEIQKETDLINRAEEIAKEKRRQEYLKLKEEFSE